MQKDRVILFDLDGTLIDSTEAILEGFEAAFSALGMQASMDDVKGLIGYPLDVMFARLGVDEKSVDFAIKTYKEHYRKVFRSKTSLLPKAKEAIEKAYLKAHLGVVTTKTGVYSKELLDELLVGEYFSVVIGREDVKNPKPHPEPILKAMDHFKGFSSKAFFMVGDTILDIQASISAGITPVGVSSGYQSEAMLLSTGAMVCKDSFEAVEWILDRSI